MAKVSEKARKRYQEKIQEYKATIHEMIEVEKNVSLKFV